MEDEPVYIYAAGTAGSGKSRFTGAMHRWMKERGLDAVTVNLDPGAETLPYAPDVDIRDWIQLADVMAEYELGPNGAQVMAADLVALRLQEITEILSEFRGQYVVVDTPGQIELFVFRESGRITMEVLGQGRSCIAFLMDPFLVKKPNAFVSLQMLSATTQFRFGVPMLNVLSKVDVLKPDELSRIQEWIANPEHVEEALMAERPDMYTQMTTDTFRVLDSLGATTQTASVSNETLEGIEDVYTWVQSVFGASEDLARD